MNAWLDTWHSTDPLQRACYLALDYPAEGHAIIRQVPVSVRDRLHQGHW